MGSLPIVHPDTLTDEHVYSGNKDGTAATPSLRTLGTGATQAAAGNHTHAGGGLADGDYGDVTVSGSGTVLTVDGYALKAPLASPALTGTPTAPTAAAATNTTQIATTAFVRTEVANLVASAPGALDTLDELAAALGDDASFASTVTTSLAGKQPLHASLTAVAGVTVTSAGTALLDDANAAAQRTTLGLAAVAASGDAADLTGTLAAGRMPAHTGDVTTSAGAVATTIANDAVTYAKMQNVSATSRVLGRKTAGAGDPEEVTASEVLDFLSTTRGSILARGAATWAALAVGTAGQVLTSAGSGADPVFATPADASRICTPLGFIPASAAGTLAIGTVECPAWYMGRAARTITSVVVRARLTVGMSGVTWAELFLAKGTPTIGSSPSLSVIGYTSVAATYTGTGLIDTTITAGGSLSIAAGEDWWIGFAKASTGTPTFRAGTIGDDLQSGLIVDAAGSTRPSTIYNAGAPTPTSFPVAINTKVAPWLRVQV